MSLIQSTKHGCHSSNSDASHQQSLTSSASKCSDVLNDIFVSLPQERCSTKKTAGVNARSVCITDDDILDDLKAKDKQKAEAQEKEN